MLKELIRKVAALLLSSIKGRDEVEEHARAYLAAARLPISETGSSKRSGTQSRASMPSHLPSNLSSGQISFRSVQSEPVNSRRLVTVLVIYVYTLSGSHPMALTQPWCDCFEWYIQYIFVYFNSSSVAQSVNLTETITFPGEKRSSRTSNRSGRYVYMSQCFALTLA